MAHGHIKPQSDDEQGINKLRPQLFFVKSSFVLKN